MLTDSPRIPATTPRHHESSAPSEWVRRWSHLIPTAGHVLDIACGSGRHMEWLSRRGHPVTGIDRSAQAISTASNFGRGVLADIESGPWPLLHEGKPEVFAGVVVTNYLWRPLFKVMAQSVAPGGVMIYETFTRGNESVGKPSRPDFLLHPGELLNAFGDLQVVAYENGFLSGPERFVQCLVAVRPAPPADGPQAPVRYPL